MAVSAGLPMNTQVPHGGKTMIGIIQQTGKFPRDGGSAIGFQRLKSGNRKLLRVSPPSAS